ncbi:MAG: aminopeptidase P family protein [Candidatus Dormibacteria bacterium]
MSQVPVEPESLPGEDDPERRRRAAHDQAPPEALLGFLVRGWEAPTAPAEEALSGLEEYRQRRERLSRRFPGQLIVVPAGVEKVRANDTTYAFRPGTDYLHLVGEGEPDEVLVLEPEGSDRHRARVFTTPSTDFGSTDFFTDRVKGSFWVGPGRGLEATRARLGVEARPLVELEQVIRRHDRGVVLRGLDPKVDRLAGDLAGPDQELAEHLSEMRLIKDGLEVELLQEACDLTRQAFEDVVRALPRIRTEREVEVAFHARARTEGNEEGYSTIAAAGSHATVLHWSRNDGEVEPGELLLLDAGVETRRYYTADITRTLPINGRFNPVQRQVYELVYRAQQAAFAEVRPGQDFTAPNRAAMEVLAQGLEEMGILPISARESLGAESQLHQRYTLHGVSHMLGLDVHDCAHARAEAYRLGRLEPGMVLTVEPGLYFQVNDGTVPPELRGIGVRIEDDVLVTDQGYRLLSRGLPSHPDELEAWMARIWSGSEMPA